MPQPRTPQPLHQREHPREGQAADHDTAETAVKLRPRAREQHQRQHAEDAGGRAHEDGAHAGAYRLRDGRL